MKMSFLCAPGALYENLHSSLPSAHSMEAICPRTGALKDDQDKEPVLHSPGVLSTWLVARAQKMFTEQHWIAKWQPDYRNALSDNIKFTISNVSSISKIFSNGIKDLQMKEKVSLFPLGVHCLAYIILKGISSKYHFYFSGWKDTFASVLIAFYFGSESRDMKEDWLSCRLILHKPERRLLYKLMCILRFFFFHSQYLNATFQPCESAETQCVGKWGPLFALYSL